jgi:DUF4097 and DUF4098 domain-containing protein YvlB
MRNRKKRMALLMVALFALGAAGCAAPIPSDPREAAFSFIGEEAGSGERTQEKKTFAADEFDSIQVSAEAMDIYVTKSADQTAYAELVTTEAIRSRITFESFIETRVLNLRVDEETNTAIFPDEGLADERKLLIALPDETYELVRIKNEFGSIEAADLQADQWDIDLAAGEIRLNRISGAMRLKADAGNIAVEGIRLDHDLSARTEAGNIYVHLTESPQAATVNLRSRLGSVSEDLKDLQYTVKSENRTAGSIGSNGYSLDASASVGDIRVDAG